MSSISAVASNSSGVGIAAAGSNDQLLSRSPIKSSFVSSSSSHLRVTPPHSKENGVVDCISRAELEKSYTNGLTKSSKNPPKLPDSQGKQQRGRGALDLCSRGYRLFQAYLKHVAMVLVTFSVVILACSLRGDLILLAVLVYKSYRSGGAMGLNGTGNATLAELFTAAFGNASNSSSQPLDVTTIPGQILPDYLQLPARYNMTDLPLYVFLAILSSELAFHAVCGFLQVYYYRMQRDQPEKWKCQPHRFLTQSNEFHEIAVGTINMFMAGGVSGAVSCWILNGNYSKVYFRLDEYGYPYLLISVVLTFLWLEAVAYYIHAWLHTPWMYKRIHKHHHRYHSPTAYSAVAMSPIEMFLLDFLFLSLLFLVPVHALVFVTVLVYIYYFGLMDHSGIKMESWFPWQPNVKFHDDHHRYFHCNFGFNSYLFDWLHGTQQKKDRLYGETIFGGKGKDLKTE